jgi:hypothetical protein
LTFGTDRLATSWVLPPACHAGSAPTSTRTRSTTSRCGTRSRSGSRGGYGLARALTVRVFDLKVDFADGEELRTEISAKFTRDRVSSELTAFGLEFVRWETDAEGDYALSLSRPAALVAACDLHPQRASAQEPRTRRRSGSSSRSSTTAVAAP